MGVQFKLLGDVSCLVGGVPLDIGHRRQRSVLAVLLLDVNRPVPVEHLIDRIWSAEAPLRARTTLYGYVHHLRRALDATGARLETREEGYRLVVDPMSVDVHRFARLAAQGWASGECVLFDLALALWQGEPLAGLESPWFDAVREDLRRQKLAVELDRNDAWLRAGRHQQLLPVVAAMTGDLPMDERLAHQFMLAAYRCGRQDEALHRFAAIRAHLAEELGADPGEALRTLHRRVLNADPGLCLPPAGGPRRPVPRQLPTPPRLFVGRASEFAALDGYLGAGRAPSPAAPIAVVHGPPGIGKTALALRWAQSRVDLFPDGQLYADLRTENPLRGFLDALGVEPSEIPADLCACAGLYRSLVAGRRMLIVLDHATDAEQVLSLLAGSATNTMIITSRDPLIELIATHGAHSVRLDALPADQARQLIAGHIGERRIASEPVAVSAILSRCGGIPLALSTAAARSLASRSRFG